MVRNIIGMLIVFILFLPSVSAETYYCSYNFDNEEYKFSLVREDVTFELQQEFNSTEEIIYEDDSWVILGNDLWLFGEKRKGKIIAALYRTVWIDKHTYRFRMVSIADPNNEDFYEGIFGTVSGECSCEGQICMNT